jgi:hypothetical protein
MPKVERNMRKGAFQPDQNLSKEMERLERGVSIEVRKIGFEELRKYGGLCSTCVHASTCGYRRVPLQPVWDCCDFEPEIGPVNLSPPLVSPLKSIAEGENPGKHAGLCVNCEHRKTCTYPRSEGGVWHCEEYE